MVNLRPSTTNASGHQTPRRTRATRPSSIMTPPKTPKRAVISVKKASSPPSPSSHGSRVRKAQGEAPVLGTEITTIHVGTDPSRSKSTFRIHKPLLTSVSAFFAAGLSSSSSFQESLSNTFSLPEEDAAIFAVFAHWCYTRNLYTASASASANEDEDGEWETLPLLYTLGERLAAPAFKDTVISAILEKVAETDIVPDNWAAYIYTHTAAPCGLRRLIVDWHVWGHRGRLLVKGASPDAEGPEAEFLGDVVGEMVKGGEEVWRLGRKVPWEVQCRYHEHGEGEGCAGVEIGEGERETEAEVVSPPGGRWTRSWTARGR